MEAPTAVSLFSGMGGMDLGARIAGVKVVAATDIDVTALALLQVAQGTPILAGDIQDTLPLLPSVVPDGSPSLVFGGPPCTPFSHAGFWLEKKRAGMDPAASLIDTFVDALRLLRPRAFILENVPGLRFRTYRSLYESLINRARRAGYTVSAAVLDSSRYGVPQVRRRLFVVGARGGPSVDLEAVPHLAKRSSGWAISDLEHSTPVEPDERPTGRHAKWLDEVPPGLNYQVLTERGHLVDPPFQYRSRYWSFLLKLHPDHPSNTIAAQRVTYNGPFHWTGRHLRIAELARLQTFPDWQPLSEDLTEARRHIGNAVPVLLAASVIRHVCVTLGLVDATTVPAAFEHAADPRASFADVTSAYPLLETHRSNDIASTQRKS